jgi:acyl-CoA thioesterase-1
MARLLLCLLWLWATDARGGESVILVVGDSLSAAYGMGVQQGWPALLEQRLRQYGYACRVVNASISGDTTSGGLSRLPAALERYRPAIMILELGANDGLRGLPLADIEHNLAAMIGLAREHGARVLLAGMRLPPNYGAPYTERFEAIYSKLAAGGGVALIPFLLDGVAGHPELTQDDGLHPRPEAQPRIVDNVWPRLLALLKECSQSQSLRLKYSSRLPATATISTQKAR